MAREPIVDARVTGARRAADEHIARNEKTSQARLNTLLRLPPAERLTHLDDGDLRPEHRTILRRSLGRHLPRSRWRFPRFRLRRGRARRLAARVMTSLLTFEISVPSLLLLAWALMAWHNTSHWMELTRAVSFNVKGADGADQVYAAGPGKAVVRYGWDGVPRTMLPLRDGTSLAVTLPADGLRPLR